MWTGLIEVWWGFLVQGSNIFLESSKYVLGEKDELRSTRMVLAKKWNNFGHTL